MLRINKLSDYAVLILVYFVRQRARNSELTARVLTEQLPIQAPTVTKILKLLTRAALLESSRGAKGGYRLTKAPEGISLAQVIEAIEGKFALTECSGLSTHCVLDGGCPVQSNLQSISGALYQTFQAISLAALARPMKVAEVPLAAFQPFLSEVSTPASPTPGVSS